MATPIGIKFPDKEIELKARFENGIIVTNNVKDFKIKGVEKIPIIQVTYLQKRSGNVDNLFRAIQNVDISVLMGTYKLPENKVTLLYNFWPKTK